MTQEPEHQDLNKLPNSSPEKKILGIDVSDVPKFLSWSSLGGTGGLCINFLIQRDWTKAAIFFLLFVITASWGLIWAFLKGFLDTLKDGLEGMGKTSGERVIENLEQQRKISTEKSLQNAAREAELKQLTDFESRYLEEQKDTCHRDEADGVREEDYLDNYPVLQEIFVPLCLIDSPRELGFNRYEELEGGQISDIWQLLRNSQDKEKLKRISIRARGGYGKTTLLKYLAYTYSNRAYGDYKAPKFIPFLLYLSRCVKLITQDDLLKLPQLLTDHAHKLLEDQEFTTPNDWAKNLLLDGQALVMLDGFDEIPSVEDRFKVSVWLNGEMQKYRKSVFILTSRPTAYRLNYPNKKLFMNYWIENFDDKQRQEFLEKWYIYQERKAARGMDRGIEKKAKARAKSLLDQINERPELKALSGNALMLNMMVRYHRDKKGKDLPQRKFELYRGICELQLERRPSEKGIRLLLNSAAERQQVLQFVALEMMQQVTSATKNDDEGFKQISHEHLIQSIEQALAKKGWNVKADDFLQQMVDVCELLVKRDENYEFSHLSFQSFLAAWELYDLKEEGEKLIYAKSSLNKWEEIDAWKETIVFYSNLVDPNKLSQKLIDLDQINLLGYLIYHQRNKDDVVAPINKLVTNTLYQQLEEYLKNQQWYEADQETWRLILKVKGREEEEWLDVEDIKNFPCEDLLTLDRLWVEYSKKHGYEFGFSVQKQIYVECGGELDFSCPINETWNKFCHITAWKEGEEWVNYPQSFFENNYMHMKGHLPRYIRANLVGWKYLGDGSWDLEGVCTSFLVSRLAKCKL